MYYYIYELDCILFIMDEILFLVLMVVGNVVYKGEKFGDEDDVVLIIFEFESGCFVIF